MRPLQAPNLASCGDAEPGVHRLETKGSAEAWTIDVQYLYTEISAPC